MKLWSLVYLPDVGYDEYKAMIVRAETEVQAREFMCERVAYCQSVSSNDWSCEELPIEGVAGVVLASFNAG